MKSVRPTPAVSIVAILVSFAVAVNADEKSAPAKQAAAKIDGFLESHWSANKVQPANRSDDATFLRRLTLDLIGRIPTTDELDKFLADSSGDKRSKTIDRLINSPEFPLHMGNVLDQMIQRRYAGNDAFVDYLRRSMRDSKSWDVMFREMMLGPWDTAEMKPANRFLDKRAKTSDVLAVDTARVFFGVDISCAKCHDHPLVDDWKQAHFYGMVAFFNRTTGGKGKIGEKKDGEVTFLGSDGQEKVAKAMFLSGQVIEEPNAATAKSDEEKPQTISRREQLVQVAIEQEEFFSRAIVNRMWDYFFGRGLVDPVDQMHSGNDSAIPGLLEWLSEDFANSGYNIRRLITAIVNSRAYQLSSLWGYDSSPPKRSLFAAAALRPLSRQQLAFSLLFATGSGEISPPSDIQTRVERYAGVTGLQRIEQYLTIEKQAENVVSSLDARRADFHSSVGEALFMSNNAASQELINAGDNNLAAQLSAIEDNNQLVTKAVRTVLSRQPHEDELTRLTTWLTRQGDDRRQASEQLVWVLVTSAEFRFNH